MGLGRFPLLLILVASLLSGFWLLIPDTGLSRSRLLDAFLKKLVEVTATLSALKP